MMGKFRRREFLAVAALPAINLFGMENGERSRVYVGTYTSGSSKSKGIYLLEFDATRGTLSQPRLVAETDEPSFLAISRSGKFLYAVNETLEYEGKPSGSVSAYAVDKSDGALTFLGRQPSGGAAPCHVSVTNDGRRVLVANYLGGNVASFPVDQNGSLMPAADTKKHSGNGPNKDRQEAPHAHSIVPDQADKFALASDLGVDRIFSYSLRSDGELTAVSKFTARPGAGPRHFKFHPNGKHAFVNNELDITVTALEYDADSGALKEIQTLSSLPAGYAVSKIDSGADMHVSSDGRFLYASNRGHDSIAVFSIDLITGKLAFIEAVKTAGKVPRNFAIDPSGHNILAANQMSDSITILRIDAESGRLTDTGISAEVPRPVCLAFAK